MKRKLTKSEDLKLMIIENFIEWYTSSDKEREAMKECAYDYVIEDHCNEFEELNSFILLNQNNIIPLIKLKN